MTRSFGLLLLTLSLLLSGCKPSPPKATPSIKHPIISTEHLEASICPIGLQAFEGPQGADWIQWPDLNGPALATTNGEALNTGSLNSALLGDGPRTLNPWAAFDASSSELGSYLFLGLVDSDPCTGEVTPLLAKALEVAPNQKQITVHLRKGLRWSDGHPISADDVLFTWNVILKEGLGNPSKRDIVSVNGEFPTVKKLSNLSLSFETPTVFAPFLRALATPIAPKHVLAPWLEKNGLESFDQLLSLEAVRQHPEQFVSNGPWLLERLVPGERVSFKPNPHFFMVDQHERRLPYVERYTISFAKDQNTLQLLFEQGQLDWLSVSAPHLRRLKNLNYPDFTLYDLGPDPGSTFVVFNLLQANDPNTGRPLVPNPQARWFNTLEFRQALNWAVDRQLLVDNVLKGVGDPLFTAEGLPSIYLHTELAKGHGVQLEKARSLLREAGFYWNEKGQLLDADGHPVSFTLMTNAGNQVREAAAVSLQEDWAQLGIQVRVKALEFNVLVGRMQSGHWETLLMGLSGGSLFEPHFSANVWKSDGALHFMHQRRPELLAEQALPLQPWEIELDALFEAGVQSLKKEERFPIYRRYQEVVAEAVPVLYLYTPRQLLAVNARLQGLQPTRLQALHNLPALWVNEAASAP